MTRHPRSFWAGLVAALERGADLHETAERHRVKATTLRWWRTQLRREHRRPPALLPVVVRATDDRVRGPAPSSSETVEIAVGGMVIRAGVGCDVRYVAALARALQPAC